MIILMTLFLLIGIGLIGYTLLQWANVSRFMFRDMIALQKIILTGCIGLVLLLISLFTLF